MMTTFLPSDVDRRGLEVALLHPVGVGQVLHRLVDAGELPPRDRQIAPPGGPAGEDDGVELAPQPVGVDVAADLDAGAELGALGPHLVEPAIEVALLHLELGDAVAQQAAEAVGPLEHHDVVAGPGELLGGGQAGGTRADHRDPLAGPHLGRQRGDPALRPGPVDDLDLDLLDRDRVLVDAEHAGRLARRGAEPPGELGEVVGGVEAVDGLAPVVPVDEVVPVGDEVAERAAVVAERDAAVHAAARLRAHAWRSGTARRPRASPAGAPARRAAWGSSRPCFRNPVASPTNVVSLSPAPGPHTRAAAMTASSTSSPVSVARRWASSTRL